MPFFHATLRGRLDSILSAGIHGEAVQNFDCAQGVYLADDAHVAMSFMIEFLIGAADDSKSPAEALSDIIVIVIDDSRIDMARMSPDPQAPGEWRNHLWLYAGIIDVTSMPILSVEDLERDHTHAGVENAPYSISK